MYLLLKFLYPAAYRNRYIEVENLKDEIRHLEERIERERALVNRARAGSNMVAMDLAEEDLYESQERHRRLSKKLYKLEPKNGR